MNTPKGEETIFAETLRLPPEERGAFLAEATAANPELRQRVEGLLQSYEMGTFLEEAAIPIGRPQALASTIRVTEKAGDTIGRYKLLQQIGEGGCGVVYMAEQMEPVRRRVALKIIKLGMDTKAVIARFEAERQALAMMDHPNIAKVLDAGATGTGRPYFVMELVRGVKITEYCDEKKLPTSERLDLFIRVCQAIQHAHQKGIIHRDIKPSNILVTLNDGVAVPKVIDFGVAKATSGQLLTDKTLFTAFEQFIGTPAYMSPEQALMTSLDIDTRSDIYALGVLLYELLTGKTPFDPKELLAIGLDEMRRTIREQEPPRPSTCLSTLSGQELSTTAQRRGLDAPKLISELRGDLDWIVMKALEKDRSRRYETTNGLAMDIGRYLNNEAVVACPPSSLYRFKKMVRRNKLVFAAGGAVITALLLGVGTSSWLFLKERAAHHRALVAEKAERKLRQEAELRELNRAARDATGYKKVSAWKRTLEEQRKLLGNEHSEVADSLDVLASLYGFDEKNFAEAEKAMKECLAIRRKLSPEGDQKLSKSLRTYALILEEHGKATEASRVWTEVVDLSRKLHGEESVETAVAINGLAVSFKDENETLPLFKKAFATCRKLLPDGNGTLAVVGGNLLRTLVHFGHLEEAAALAEDFVPNNFSAERENLLGRVLFLVNELEAQVSAERAEQVLNRIIAKAPDNKSILYLRAQYRAEHGHWRQAAEDFTKLIEAKTADDGDAANHENWHKLAVLLVQTGELSRYREHCRESIRRFSTSTDAGTAHRIAKDCLILPDSGVDLTVVDRMVTTSLGGGRKWGAFGATKAMLEYRLSRFESAVDWAEDCLAHGTDDLWAQGQASAILAMALQKMQRSKEARAALERAGQIIKNELPSLESSKVGFSWIDIIICHALLREAEGLINGGPEAGAQSK